MADVTCYFRQPKTINTWTFTARHQQQNRVYSHRLNVSNLCSLFPPPPSPLPPTRSPQPNIAALTISLMSSVWSCFFVSLFRHFVTFSLLLTRTFLNMPSIHCVSENVNEKIMLFQFNAALNCSIFTALRG